MQQKYKKSMQKLSTETAGLQIQVQLFVLAKQTRGCFYIIFYAFWMANHILSICTLYLWSSCIPPSAYIELIVQNADQRTEVETTKNKHGGLTCHKDVPLETLSTPCSLAPCLDPIVFCWALLLWTPLTALGGTLFKTPPQTDTDYSLWLCGNHRAQTLNQTKIFLLKSHTL